MLFENIIMQLAIISPTSYLEKFTTFNGNNYYMVLAHRYLTDPIYRKFYDKKRLKTGSIIILDNSACELDSALSDQKLIQVISNLKPDIFVLPDVLDDSAKTLERTLNFITKYNKLIKRKKKDIRYIAVPQGKTFTSWMKSFDMFYKNNNIDMIGLSNVSSLNIKGIQSFDRIDAIKFLECSGYTFNNKNIHILGLGDSGHLEIGRMSKFQYIEGVDTSAPIVHGYYDVLFQNHIEYKKINQYLPDDLSTMTKEQIQRIYFNLGLLYGIIKSNG